MSVTFDVQNPATGARVQSVPNAGAAEARVGSAPNVASRSGRILSISKSPTMVSSR